MIIAVIAVLSLVLGADFISAPVDMTTSSSSVIINGSTTTYETSVSSINFTISTNELILGVGILLGLIAIASLFGLRILGSGLSDESVRVIVFVTVYGGIWMLLSLLAWNLITQIEIFGYFIYAILSICYAVGCIQKFYGGKS